MTRRNVQHGQQRRRPPSLLPQMIGLVLGLGGLAWVTWLAATLP